MVISPTLHLWSLVRRAHVHVHGVGASVCALKRGYQKSPRNFCVLHMYLQICVVHNSYYQICFLVKFVSCLMCITKFVLCLMFIPTRICVLHVLCVVIHFWGGEYLVGGGACADGVSRLPETAVEGPAKRQRAGSQVRGKWQRAGPSDTHVEGSFGVCTFSAATGKHLQ